MTDDHNGPRLPSYDPSEEQAVLAQIEEGGRFICYQYAVGALIVSFKRFSDVRYYPPGSGFVIRFLHGLSYSLMTIPLGLLGKWSIIWSIEAIFRNSFGGIDVTKDIELMLKRRVGRKARKHHARNRRLAQESAEVDEPDSDDEAEPVAAAAAGTAAPPRHRRRARGR